MKEEMRASQELLKDEMLAKMETNHKKMDARTDANQEKWKPEQIPIMRTLRSFKALSSPGWISTKSGQCPLENK
jgi:hypothetical protein